MAAGQRWPFADGFSFGGHFSGKVAFLMKGKCNTCEAKLDLCGQIILISIWVSSIY